jgi:diguanylate cyclase (GGDEF)-like protein
VNRARVLIAQLGILLWAGAAAASSFAFRRITIPDDVPAHLCSALAQDTTGFLWIGTQGGLVRYDGSAFRVYRPDSANAKSLSGSYVRSILAARDGSVWVGTFSGGVSHFDPASGTFTRYQHDSRNPASLTNDRVEGLAEEADGSIWIATSAGLDRLDPHRNTFTHFLHDAGDPKSLADDTVRGLLVDRAKRLWVGTHDGMQRWLGDGRGFERIASDHAVNDSLAGEFVTKIFEDRLGRIWIGTAEHGAAVFDPGAKSLRRLWPRPRDANGLSHFWIYGFAEGPGDEMWVATFGGGIDVVDERSLLVVSRNVYDATLPDTVGADRIGAILGDRSGVIWAGTWGEGIAFHDPRSRAFRAFRYSPNDPEGLSYSAVVRALGRADGTIVVGTNGNGLDLFDTHFHRTGSYRPAALSDGSITCLAESSDHSLWIATLNGALQRLGGERFTPADGLPGGPIRTIAFAPNGALFVGSAYGMARVDPRTKRVTAWRHAADDPASLSGTAVESIVVASNGHLWVGTDDGLDDFDPATGHCIAIHHDARDRYSLPDNWVPDLLLARDGRLWVGTHGGAAVLQSWHGGVARFEIVAEKVGRPPAPAESLVEDDEGRVWIGPRLRVDPRNWSSRTFGRADGIVFRNFFIASRGRSNDGRLLFGSPEGLLVVDPHAIPAWRDDAPVVLTSLHVAGAESTDRIASLTLRPAARSFRADFTALDLAAPPSRYRYRLDGVDRDWIITDGDHRSLAYDRLPPGSYLLRIGAADHGGGWSRNEMRLPIVAVPAVWETAPFRLLLIAAAIAAAYALYRLRVRQLRERSARLERIVAERTSELAERNRELGVAYARIEDASLTDALTGLRNRRYLAQALPADLAITLRQLQDGKDAGESSLILFLVDLDHFKSVNDSYGHPAGDAVLVQVAEVIRRQFRESDHVVRWGGEEFLLVARFTRCSDGAGLAEALRTAIAGHPFVLPDGTTLRRTASIGFSAWPASTRQPRAAGWEAVVAAADAALYLSKASGRDCWTGVDVSEAVDPAQALEDFRRDPSAIGNGIRIETAGGNDLRMQQA